MFWRKRKSTRYPGRARLPIIRRKLPMRYHMKHQFTVRDLAFTQTMHALTGSPIVDGNRVEILRNGVQIFPSMLAAIRAAHKTINLEFYIYWDGEIGRQFAEALAEAERDPELRAWLFEQGKSYNDIREKLRTITVPDDLREKIVRERPIVFPKPTIRARVWQVAAAVALLAGISGFFSRDLVKNRGLRSQTRAAAGAAAGTADGSTVTITGEVLDMACYIAFNLSGPEHADCARTCIKNGLPVGIKAPDGKAYLLVGANEPLNNQLADYAAKTVTVKGIIRQRNGFLMLDQVTLEKL